MIELAALVLVVVCRDVFEVALNVEEAAHLQRLGKKMLLLLLLLLLLLKLNMNLRLALWLPVLPPPQPLRLVPRRT